MAAGLHGNPHQEEILRLLLSRGADPSIRNLENDQAAHLLQSGHQGEQVSHPTGFLVKYDFVSILIPLFAPAQTHAEETQHLLSSSCYVLTGPGMICPSFFGGNNSNTLPVLIMGIESFLVSNLNQIRQLAP